MSAEVNDSDCCLNCHAELQGEYCCVCGQARSARLVPMKDWLGEIFGSFLKLDSKLLRTLKQIMFQPGQATIDFGKGKRIPYCPPARAYIIVSAVSIAAMTIQGAFSHDIAIPGLNADADFQKRVQFLFPVVNLMSPLITAAVLAVFQRKFFLQLNLAFSLHFWTFLVVIGTPLIFIPPTSVWSLIAFAVMAIITITYLFRAHGAVFAMPKLNRIFTCAMVLLSLPIATVLFGVVIFGLAKLAS